MNILKFKPKQPNCEEFLGWTLDRAALNGNYTESINNSAHWVEDEVPYITRADIAAPNRNNTSIRIDNNGLVFNNQSINTNHYFSSTMNNFNDRLTQIESQINTLLRIVNEQNNSLR